MTAAKLRFYAAAVLALAALGGVFRFFQRRIIIGASRDIEFDLRNDFFARLQLFEPAYFHRNRTGDLMSRATNDLNAVRMMIGPAVMYLSNTVLTFIAVIARDAVVEPAADAALADPAADPVSGGLLLRRGRFTGASTRSRSSCRTSAR